MNVKMFIWVKGRGRVKNYKIREMKKFRTFGPKFLATKMSFGVKVMGFIIILTANPQLYCYWKKKYIIIMINNNISLVSTFKARFKLKEHNFKKFSKKQTFVWSTRKHNKRPFLAWTPFIFPLLFTLKESTCRFKILLWSAEIMPLYTL